MEIKTYQSQSGQWSFVIYDDDGIDVVRGGGFSNEDEAAAAAEEFQNPQRVL